MWSWAVGSTSTVLNVVSSFTGSALGGALAGSAVSAALETAAFFDIVAGVTFCAIAFFVAGLAEAVFLWSACVAFAITLILDHAIITLGGLSDGTLGNAHAAVDELRAVLAGGTNVKRGTVGTAVATGGADRIAFFFGVAVEIALSAGKAVAGALGAGGALSFAGHASALREEGAIGAGLADTLGVARGAGRVGRVAIIALAFTIQFAVANAELRGPLAFIVIIGFGSEGTFFVACLFINVLGTVLYALLVIVINKSVLITGGITCSLTFNKEILGVDTLGATVSIALITILAARRANTSVGAIHCLGTISE